ncbi:LysR substrate-binding domain-containing protein [Devriesea agamarum]|uniref:LysR substrate-binding domain-containing protein n=1 Tax=Devriesea agamarum TaxID=472569 RepID=UPI00155DEDF3|nr:LysR substrate-binding domain-containing protein [Devriesea agamarum]
MSRGHRASSSQPRRGRSASSARSASSGRSASGREVSQGRGIAKGRATSRGQSAANSRTRRTAPTQKTDRKRTVTQVSAGLARPAVPLRIGYVPGVEPGRWISSYAKNPNSAGIEAVLVSPTSQEKALVSGEVDACFMRAPVDSSVLSPDQIHRLDLWEEVAVAVLPKDHPASLETQLVSRDLAEETLLPPNASRRLEDADELVSVVAAGVGVAVLPMSLARLYDRKDVVHVPLSDLAGTQIALVWRRDRDAADVQLFVAVVRGRTVRSSR